MEIDVTGALVWPARICCVGVVIQSLELAALGRELRPGHLLGRPMPGDGSEVPREAWISADLGVLLGRAVAAAFVVVAPDSWAAGWLLLLLLLCQLYHARRFRLVGSNADHMTLVVLAACAVGLLPGGAPWLSVAAVGFMAFQVLLAYVASGLAKGGAPGWRDGTRIVQIFQDSAHRCPPLGRLFAARPRLARTFSWLVMIGEVLFPLGLLLPKGGFLAVLAAGLAFHAAIGVAMGLPAFFWAFAATYPALYFVFARLQPALPW